MSILWLLGKNVEHGSHYPIYRVQGGTNLVTLGIRSALYKKVKTLIAQASYNAVSYQA